MKSVIIFGGNGRIGKEVCRALKKEFYVYCADISASETTQHYDEYIRCDLNNQWSVMNAFDTALKRNNIYGIVNCMYWRDYRYGKPWYERYDKEVTTFLNNNLISTIGLLKDARTNNVKNVVLLSSIYGEKTPEFWVYKDTLVLPCPLEYAICKAALNQMVKYLAKRGMHINAVAPGGIESDDMDNQFKENYTQIAPFTDSKDVARAVKHLLTNEGINGQIITVDNGWSV